MNLWIFRTYMSRWMIQTSVSKLYTMNVTIYMTTRCSIKQWICDWCERENNNSIKHWNHTTNINRRVPYGRRMDQTSLKAGPIPHTYIMNLCHQIKAHWIHSYFGQGVLGYPSISSPPILYVDHWLAAIYDLDYWSLQPMGGGHWPWLKLPPREILLLCLCYSKKGGHATNHTFFDWKDPSHIFFGKPLLHN